ncbi:MAG TPA: SPOR domain-containing protein [Bacteroidales bacterium]|nr:SPOR domain-containing protein [Bacteroidales bacterium]
MRKFFLLIGLLSLIFGVFAQNTNGTMPIPIVIELQTHNAGEGTVTIRQNETITQIHSIRYLHNAKSPGMEGYRIRIFFELGQFARKNSEDIMQAFMEKYPGVPVYQNYQNPYWKVSVGDYRSREEAIKFYNQIIKDYPKAFIIPERINFPLLN